MAERPMGVETEYGFSVTGRIPDLGDRESDSSELVALARKNYRYLKGNNDTGIFLENGARFYIDAGAHPELCTPEVLSPFEVVRYAEAGDEILTKLAAKFPANRRALLFKCNVDYVSDQTWAAHENYGHRCDPKALPGELIPHLASRLIYTGAGGFNPKSHGIEFCISPRVFHLETNTTSSSTGGRGIYHLKNESLSKKGWNRMHVLCGESLCSHLASALKFGTTALIVALVEGGKHPGADVQMKSPIDGMSDFCEDISLQAKTEMEGGRCMTALDIQWHYLRFVEANLGDPCLPKWAGRICEEWRNVLERLSEDGVKGVGTRMDWAIKHALYTQHMERRGVTSEEVHSFNALEIVRRSKKRGPNIRDIIDPAIDQKDSARDDPASEVPAAQESSKLTGEQKAKLERVRCELFELDVRYSQLGGSIFSSLDRAGLLDHCLPEVSRKQVRNAVRQPPDAGRARLRGELIKSLRPRSNYRCDWHGVWSSDGTWIDLSDPELEKAPEWVKANPRRHLSESDHCGLVLLHTTGAQYDLGNYELAFEYLGRYRRDGMFGNRIRFRRLYARVQSRRGFLPQALEALEALDERLESSRPRSYAEIFELIDLHRYEGIVPGAGYLQLLDEARPAFEQEESHSDHQRIAHRGNVGLGHYLRGELSLAESILSEAVSRRNRGRPFSRLYARIKTDLTDVYRRLGRTSDARRELAEAERFYLDRGFTAELSDSVLLRRAKLESKSANVCEILDGAERIQTGANNQLGLAKTHLLRARILKAPAESERSHNLLSSYREQVPVLQTCPLFKKIMEHWGDWISGQQLIGETDEFWGM